MSGLAADENFNMDIVRGLLHSRPQTVIVRIQQEGLSAAPDPVILDWCEQKDMVLLTHDQKTIPQFTYERIAQGKHVPGVLLVKASLSVAEAVADLILLLEGSLEGELEDRVTEIPLR